MNEVKVKNRKTTTLSSKVLTNAVVVGVSVLVMLLPHVLAISSPKTILNYASNIVGKAPKPLPSLRD